MSNVYYVWKVLCTLFGSVIGYLLAKLEPTFPLASVAVLFILYDSYTAYKLSKRVHKQYPEDSKGDGKFTSFAFGKTVRVTIPTRLALIFLAYLVEHFVFNHSFVPLAMMITGAICFEQFVSILENESSCRAGKDGRFWKMLRRVLIDKTERHLGITLDELKEKEREEANKLEVEDSDEH
nr:MAG TPA: holin [Caudoviricetes sp.]